MIKKIQIVIFTALSLSIFADDNTNNGYMKNRPSIGSKPASNQLFGEPQLNNEHKEKYTRTPGTRDANRPAIGSKPASNQLFGNQPLTGKSGQKYHQDKKNTSEANKPSIGSKPASNQLFGNQPLVDKDSQK
ncbi:MAG TPA: hypothetical protein PKD00_02330 [Burkholderiales bacterium]|nr:hypothetical protein [Burkholderiales bacterium]